MPIVEGIAARQFHARSQPYPVSTGSDKLEHVTFARAVRADKADQASVIPQPDI